LTHTKRKLYDKYDMRKSTQSGQILLIVVLSMVVALSVSLSIASRTISNLRISKQNEESQRAFQAAEAGLERAVRQVYSGGNVGEFAESLTNNADFTVDIQPEQGNMQLNGGDFIERAVGLDVWLSNYPDYTSPYNGRVQLHWGNTTQTCNGSGDEFAPALEVLLIYGDRNNPQLMREVFDPCNPTRVSGSSTGQIGAHDHLGTRYQYSATFPSSGNIVNGLLFKVIPIFNSTRMGIGAVGSATIPTQGSVITSTGKSGDAVRKIKYFQSYPQIPNELFPYAIVSQNDTP
jgi:hypothetical protein